MSHKDFSDFQRKMYNSIGTRLCLEKMSGTKAHDLAEALVEMLCEHFPEIAAAPELLRACMELFAVLESELTTAAQSACPELISAKATIASAAGGSQ